jgi:hypothetical protein
MKFICRALTKALHWSVCLSVCLRVCLSVCLCVCLRVCAISDLVSVLMPPDSLRKLIQKFSPTKKFEAIEALIEAAIRDLPQKKGSDFVYASFFAENRNGNQGEVRGVLFDAMGMHCSCKPKPKKQNQSQGVRAAAACGPSLR